MFSDFEHTIKLFVKRFLALALICLIEREDQAYIIDLSCSPI